MSRADFVTFANGGDYIKRLVSAHVSLGPDNILDTLCNRILRDLTMLGIWREQLNIVVTRDSVRYVLPSDEYTEGGSVYGVYLEGGKLGNDATLTIPPGLLRQQDSLPSSPLSTRGSLNRQIRRGRPENWTNISKNEIDIWPIPDNNYELTLDMKILVRNGAMKFPKHLLDNFADEISAGIEYDLLTNATSYTASNLAEGYQTALSLARERWETVRRRIKTTYVDRAIMENFEDRGFG